MDAESLCGVSGQIGTLVLDRSGRVLSSTGQLLGAAGDSTGKLIYSILQDSQSVLDDENKEELQRLIVDFSTYDVVVTLDEAQIYVVKRSKAPQSE
ncbi:hypothetical protein P43SY_000774 [Pythium insidiosum]|uniref:Uncharacterized protein n=1 Tax=Pythium insidiosum TaxID=114742 RepID=A0AAD5Q417_PYTIN|nr:hypothetical protein P43SY_000774 [Pythium insidiosum]